MRSWDGKSGGLRTCFTLYLISLDPVTFYGSYLTVCGTDLCNGIYLIDFKDTNKEVSPLPLVLRTVEKEEDLDPPNYAPDLISNNTYILHLKESPTVWYYYPTTGVVIVVSSACCLFYYDWNTRWALNYPPFHPSQVHVIYLFSFNWLFLTPGGFLILIILFITPCIFRELFISYCIR